MKDLISVKDYIRIEAIFMSDELALIDLNLLSYVFDKSEPKKRIICGELVAECWKVENSLFWGLKDLGFISTRD